MLALPCPGRLNKIFSACDTLELLDPLVPLQVLHQRRPLDESFWAHCAVVVPCAGVDLLMSVPHVGKSHPCLATFKPASVFLFSSVFCHVGAKVVLVATIFGTHTAYAWVLLVVLILLMVGEG